MGRTVAGSRSGQAARRAGEDVQRLRREAGGRHDGALTDLAPPAPVMSPSPSAARHPCPSPFRDAAQVQTSTEVEQEPLAVSATRQMAAQWPLLTRGGLAGPATGTP